MATKKAQPLQANGPASTSVAVRKPSAGGVVSIKEAIAAQIAALGDRIAPPGGSKIKLQAGKMTMPDGTATPGPVPMVVVDFVARNMFYENDYDANNIESVSYTHLMLDLSKSMRMVMTTHDEMVACVKKAQASSASAKMLKRMTVPLDWCKDLPLSSEGGHAFNYSK